MSKTRLWAVLGIAVGALTACGPDNAGGSAPSTTVEGTTTAPAAAAGGTNTELECRPGDGRTYAGSTPMNFTNLENGQLGCAVFDHQTMNSVNLRRGHLSGARFQDSTLNRVDFRDAVLRGAEFTASTLNVVDFRNANLTGADLRDAHLNAVDFAGATCPDGATSADAHGCTGHLTPADVGIEPATTGGGTATGTESSTSSSGGSETAYPAAPAAFNEAAHGTYRCASADSTVSVNGANSALHLTGPCGTVVVNGALSDVEVDAAQRIIVNAAKASVVYHGSPKVTVNGNGATAHHG